MRYSEDDILNISGIQHFVFCRRQWALIHIEQQWAENLLTVSGEIMHKNAHDNGFSEKRGDTIISRGMPVVSYELGIRGVCDVVEFHSAADGAIIHGYDGRYNIVPVEYKHGEPKENDSDILQTAAQALCLEDMFCTSIDEIHLFYGKTKRRLRVPLDEKLRERLKNILDEMHSMYNRQYTPQVKTGKNCKSCSLAGLCLPKLSKVQSVSSYIKQNVEDE